MLSLFYDANEKHHVTLCQTNLDLCHTNKLTEAADPHLDALPLNRPIHQRSTRLLSGHNDDGGRSIGHRPFQTMLMTERGL